MSNDSEQSPTLADSLGEELAFIISQPRSGSTLLQKLLAQHTKIHSLAEPWFMLPLTYLMHPSGVQAEYNAPVAYEGFRKYLDATRTTDQEVYTALRRVALDLYEPALQQSGKAILIDKTPRYYLVLKELAQIFPRAKFIFLVRNPMAVFTSILESHAQNNWTQMLRPDRVHDVLTAPKAILEASTDLAERGVMVRYEELVTEPDNVLGTICTHLGVELEEGMVRYSPGDSTGLGDTKSINVHDRPVSDYTEAWRQRLDTTTERELAVAYLQELGEDTSRRLGYPFDYLVAELLKADARTSARRISRYRRFFANAHDESRWQDAWRLSIAKSIQDRGWGRTILRAFYIAVFGKARTRSERAAATAESND